MVPTTRSGIRSQRLSKTETCQQALLCTQEANPNSDAWQGAALEKGIMSKIIANAWSQNLLICMFLNFPRRQDHSKRRRHFSGDLQYFWGQGEWSIPPKHPVSWKRLFPKPNCSKENHFGHCHHETQHTGSWWHLKDPSVRQIQAWQLCWP